MNIINNIIDASDDCTSWVIEIGPGMGSLTEQLARHAKRVLAFEINRFSFMPIRWIPAAPSD